MRAPYTHEELQSLVPKIKEELEQLEAEEGPVKPIPPLAKEECIDYLFRIISAASDRPLTRSECFLFGQVLAQFEQSVIAETLGKKGRYYVLPEEVINKRL